LMIGLVMWPSFQRQVKSAIPKRFHNCYYATATIHAALGTTAEVLGLYILILAGTNLMPQRLRCNHWKALMRTELALWLVVLVSGMRTCTPGIYDLCDNYRDSQMRYSGFV
jgi:uncharacterized membrane protein YozB (DUF420 family)